MLTVDNTRPVKGIPPAMKDRYVVRCKEASFGPSKSDKPMITVKWELVGLPMPDNTVQTILSKGGKEYMLAGLNVNPSYHVLTAKAITFYAAFWEACNPGLSFPGVDETNPDLSFFDGLCMQAILNGTETRETKQLTEEEKADKIAKGEQPIGDPILDADGNPIMRSNITITQFLKKWTGELPDEMMEQAPATA